MGDTRTDEVLPEPARATFDAVLDCLIPPSEDGRMTGAGALGLGEIVLQRFGEGASALRPALEALDARSRETDAARFVALPPERRADVLAAYAESDPGFLPGLVFHTFSVYYQDSRVQNALGMEGRPPHPKGYTIGPDDPRLLDPVRARPSLYRRP